MLSMPDGNSSAALGFLAVVEHEVHGLFGGYLLLNAAGRPLEFHCSAPMKPNRAQQILYGPTLEPYLYGEQIGATLVQAAKQPAAIVFVEQTAALAVREHIDLPVALVVGGAASGAASFSDARPLLDRRPDGEALTVGQNHLVVPRRYAADCKWIGERLGSSDDWFDFSEPFQRIRTAIEEAQRASSKAA
jgi:hypothetical protein